MEEEQAICKGVKNSAFKTEVNNKKAFSLIEVLIVVTIVALLVIALLFFLKKHMMRARDGRRKSDINKLEVVFEEYYNDHKCYPPYEAIQECGVISPSSENVLSPNYLKEIPCDPLTNQPYTYFSYNGDYCSGYRLLAKLEIEDDPEIAGIGCNYENGCNIFWGPPLNYGVHRGWEIDGYCTDGRDGEGNCLGDEWIIDDDRYRFRPVACLPQTGPGGERVAACHRVSEQDLIERYDCPKLFASGGCSLGTNCTLDSPDLCRLK